ncbi:cyclic nucleotide-binding domain-containing protein [Pedobacter hiemivivus]|uniref:Crp/Fnr family transcriptional regulator n=1 Tax=Pedobacter hiemivivus TaxID=2530454 RepID=A0A4R0NGA5_9SPHI|nr:Crp/Fnr family transcriptional regulator [Pedobacter hiemivivus]TCC99560.1 Crp/Fnr family transcriptional regulator [Pedobacter hiemivivus]
MKAIENEPIVRLEWLIREELVPKLENLDIYLTEECIEYIILNSKLEQVAKDQYIQKNGSYIHGHLYFLYTGIAFGFYHDQLTDRRFATRLWKANEIIFDTNSFLNCEDRIEDIQMLEDGELISINYNSLKVLLDKFPEVFALLPYLTIPFEKHSTFYQNMLKSNFKKRVSLFLQHNPTLINKISIDTIALYLNMPKSSFNRSYALYKHNKDDDI